MYVYLMKMYKCIYKNGYMYLYAAIKPFYNTYVGWHLQHFAGIIFWLPAEEHWVPAVSREEVYFLTRTVDKIQNTDGHTWWIKVIWHVQETRSKHWGMSHSIQN